MLTKKRQSLWARIAMTLLLAMVGMVAEAQTFVVVDKSGNRVTYDVSKIEQVTFQEDPPGFTVYEVKDEPASSENPGTDPGTNPGSDPGSGQGQEEPPVEQTSFTFDEVASFSGDPDFLFTHPDTVYVGGEKEDVRFQFRTNVDYTYKVSDDWLKYISPINNTDSLRFIAGMNPMTEKRIGYIAFASKDEQIADTVWVIQAGKLDSRYIDIDWAKATLDNFDEKSGNAQITFTGDVPVMGDYDVVLLPKEDSYIIRLIDKIQQEEGSKTVNLTTRQGLMGNLFKGTKFKLATEAGAKTRGDSDDGVPVYLPTKVELYNGDQYVEVYNTAKSGTRAPQGFENEFISWEYNDDGKVLWESGVQSLSWDQLNFNIGLKGLFSFDFGDVAWEKVRMGDLQNLKITLEGGFDMNLVMKYAVASEVSYEKEWTLKENAIPNLKYTFMVGTVPVYITVGADLMANISLGASGEASITTGVTASTKVNYGVEWDYEKGLSKIAECEKNLELVGPDLDINAHAEARATAYPKIEIGIYKVLCPTISPQPYIKAEADGRLVDNQYVAWNAGVSTGIDLGLGLCLDLFFWKKDLGEIDPINVFDLPIVSLPDEIELINDAEEEVLINGKREVKYHVTNKNYLTGTTYNAPGVLVHFEAEGGELEDEYGYTDSEGNVSAIFTLTDTKGGTVKTEVVLGAEPEKEEDAMKADDWQALAIDHRLTPSPASQEIEKDATAAIVYKLERYTSKTGEWTGFGGQTIEFEATGGTVAPTSGVTAQDGTVAITFTPEADATEGKVTGTTSGKDPDPWSKISSATVKVKSEDGGDDLVIVDEGLKKAAKQKPNVYVVEDKTTGETQTRQYVSEGSEWNKDQDAISFQLEDADENGGTLGMIWGFIPKSMADIELALTAEQFANSPGAKFGFDVYEGTQVSGDFMSMTEHTEGNLQPESKIMLHKVKSSAATRGNGDEEYTGEYELLFYLVFKNQTWNSETHQYDYGDEYEVYGRGTMAMHIPTITSFQVSTEDQYVKVGNSTKVKLTQYYEENAEWNWDDVELVAQYVDYDDRDKDLGFFTWDAATQTLTAVKSNDNQQVSLTFALKSKPDVKSYLTVKVGEGWKYTMFKVGPEEQTASPGSGCSFRITDFAPRENEDEAFDNTAIEIDPESDPDDNFRYYDRNNQYSARLDVYRTSIAPGEYTLRFRLKSDHSIGSTMKITIISESTEE